MGDNLEAPIANDQSNNNHQQPPKEKKKGKKDRKKEEDNQSSANNGVVNNGGAGGSGGQQQPTARELEAEMNAEEKREREEKKARREPPIVFRDVCNHPEELLDALEQSLHTIDLNEEEMRCLKELREYCLGDEGSWVLSDDFLGLIGRILLTDPNIQDDARVYCLKVLSWVGVTKDDVILVLHQDRRDHIIMRYANNIDQLSLGCQEGVALLLCNLFENLSTSEWLLYISEWETCGFGPNAPLQVTSNIRVTTKVAVHALLSKELRDVGSALIYNMVAKEVKTARLGVTTSIRAILPKESKSKVFDDVAVEIAMAILQFLTDRQVPEPLSWRGLKALLRCCQLARGEVPNLIKMVGPNPVARATQHATTTTTTKASRNSRKQSFEDVHKKLIDDKIIGNMTQSQAIPRRVTITSASQLPNEYSTTPGGTIYSTTPGGTRIVYERAFLMQLRNSPLAKTPPKNMQMIPGLSPSISPSKLIQDNSQAILKQAGGSPPKSEKAAEPTPGVPVDEQFQMEL